MKRALSVVLVVAVVCGFSSPTAEAVPGVRAQAVPGSVVDIELTWDEGGYWLLRSDGAISVHGNAATLGDAVGQLAGGEQAVSMSAKPGGGGYWIFTTRGRVLNYGTAAHFGDMAGVTLNGPVLDSVATPTGLGYYMVASDGGVFTFGDAKFFGSMGGRHLNGPVNGLAPTADNEGYWLVADDGGIFSFGSAQFYGSMGGRHLNRPVVAMIGQGNGYLMLGSDGGIFNFGQSKFHGSLGGNPPASPVVAVAPKRDLSGYRMVTAAGGVHAFGNTDAIPDPDPDYEVPTAPQSVAAAQVGETAAVSVIFAAPANAAVANVSTYEVSCDSSEPGTPGPVFTGSGASSPITVNVEVGRWYTCAVRAVGSEGPGAWAPASAVAVGHAAPGNVQIVAGDGEVTVSWDPVDATNLDGYAWISSSSENGPLTGTGDVDAGTTSVTIDGLANGAAVWVTIYAESSVANVTSELSAWVSATPTAVPIVTSPPPPQSPAAAQGDGAEISVSFTAPSSNGGAAIVDYLAECLAGGDSFGEIGTTSPLVVDVEWGRSYQCQVRARNSEGFGVAADAGVVVVPHPAPANVTAVATDGDVEVTWDAVPAQNLAGYTLLVSDNAAGTDATEAATGVETTSWTLEGLQAGVPLWIGVQAVADDSNVTSLIGPWAPVTIPAATGPDVSSPGDLARVSLSSLGTQLDEGGQLPPVTYTRGPAVSADGRYVLFTSEVPGLVTGDLFVRDTVAGTTTAVVDTLHGQPAEGLAFEALLSGDGRHVAFKFQPYENGNPVGNASLYVHDMEGGTTEVVSIDPDGDPYSYSTLVGISSDGGRVFFHGDGSDMLPGELRVRDVDAGTTGVVDLAGPDRNASVNGAASHLMMSGDGRYLALADNPAFSTLFPIEGRGTLDVVLIDMVTDEVFRVSPPLPADLPEGAARLDGVQAISTDGRYLLYQSSLFDWDAGFPWPYISGDLLLFDRVTGTRSVVAESFDGQPIDAPAGAGAVSDDGRYVAFVSAATNIVDGDDNGVADVFVRDMAFGTTIIVPGLAQMVTDGLAVDVEMSADGSRVVFTSAASNLASGDTNDREDVFVFAMDFDAFDPPVGLSVEEHCGEITADEVWSADAVHHLTCEVETGSHTITVEPGAIVKQGTSVGVNVNNGGAFHAVGTAESRITFTHIDDDAAGGDTNGDGPLTYEIGGGGYYSYSIFRFIEPDRGSDTALSYVDMRYSRIAISGGYASPTAPGPAGTLRMDNSTVRQSGAVTELVNPRLAQVTLEGNDFDELVGTAATARVRHADVSIRNNRFGPSREAAAISLGDLDPTGVVVEGAERNTILGTPTARSLTASNVRVPEGSEWTVGPAEISALVGEVEVHGTLTLLPGAVLKATSGLHTVNVEGGVLNVLGAQESPVVFTHAYDDSAGGDTNGDGNESNPEDLNNHVDHHIEFTEGSAVLVEHAELRWTEFGAIRGDGNLFSFEAEAALTVRDSTVEHAGGGVHVDPVLEFASLEVVDSTFDHLHGEGIFTGEPSEAVIHGNVFGSNRQDAALRLRGPVHQVQLSGPDTNVISGDPAARAVILDGATVPVGEAWTFDPTAMSAVHLDNIGSGWSVWVEGDLTIPPGALVKSNTEMRVREGGSLTAVGTPDQPITFTAYADDTAGGDTNGDVAASSPTPGDADAFMTADGGTARLSHVNARFCGTAIEGGWDELEVTRSTFTACLAGMDVSLRSLESESVISDNLLDQLTGDFHALTVSYAGRSPVVERNTFGPARVGPALRTDNLPLDRVDLHGADSNAILGDVYQRGVTLQGTVPSGTTWRVDPDTGFSAVHGAEIEVSGTFIPSPGTVFKSSRIAVQVRAGGVLVAQGTGVDPIVFTSPFDDAGGNTSGSASSATRDGTGIRFDQPVGSDTVTGVVFRNLEVGVRVGALSALHLEGNKFTETDMSISVVTTVEVDPAWGSLPCAPPYTTLVSAPGNWFGHYGPPGVSFDPTEFVGMGAPEGMGSLVAATNTLLGIVVDTTISSDNAVSWSLFSCSSVTIPWSAVNFNPIAPSDPFPDW